VLSSENDEFFKKNMFEPYSEVGLSMKRLADEYIAKTKGSRAITSIADMDRLIADYPDINKKEKDIGAHVAIAMELSRFIEEKSITELSALEQEIVCGDDHGFVSRKIADLLERRDISNDHILRLLMLYTLRYEQQRNDLEAFISHLFRIGMEEARVELIAALKVYAGAEARSGNPFDNHGLKVEAVKTLKGLEHVAAYHTPMLYSILVGIINGSLRDADFPFVVGELGREKPQDIIVFIAGGATYHEALVVDNLNRDPTFPARVILGGSCVLNSRGFMHELMQVRKVKRSSYAGNK